MKAAPGLFQSTWLAAIGLLAFGNTCSAVPLSNESLPHTHRLLDDLFRYYRKEIRPIRNASTALNVTVHLWFKQVLKVDEIDQVLTIYLWIEEYWVDEFLTWEPEKYGGVNVLHVPAGDVWRPDLLFYNNADMNIKENELTTNAVIQSNGEVMCFRAVIAKITCNLDMTYFPFDQQNCSMMMASWSADGSKVFVANKHANNNLIYYIENTEWKLLNFSYRHHMKYYDCCPEPYPDITYYFLLERNPNYYVLNLIIPSVFITIVTMVGFFTPYSSDGENTEKVSLGVTALLSLAIILLMVADKMPATSKVVPLIGKYYIGLIWLIFAATIITTVTLRLQSKGNAGKPLSPATKRLFFRYLAPLLCMNVDLPPKERTKEYADVLQEKVTEESLEPLIHVNGRMRVDSSCHSFDLESPPNRSVQKNRLMAANGNRTDCEAMFGSGHVPPDRHLNPFKDNVCEEEPVYISIVDTLSALMATVQNIDNQLQWRMDYKYIQSEWGQLARVVERLLMIAFIIGTILFAALITVLAVPMPVVTFWG